MEIISDPAASYRAEHQRKLMVLTKSKSAELGRDEFCRIRSVETLAPSLWITATFLDGAVRQFRPEKIRDATVDEERRAAQLLAAPVPVPPVIPVNALAPL